ncbi:MAG: PD40 domain-containing protein [Anaerolineae bacterium]|nr:PD40 domain-containing protein [Anaerolineae bacterium]
MHSSFHSLGRKLARFVFLILLLSSSCNNFSPTDTSPAVPTEAVYPDKNTLEPYLRETLVSTRSVPQVTPSGTSIPDTTRMTSVWEGLTASQYIVFSALSFNENEQALADLKILSADGKIERSIVNIPEGSTSSVKLSPNRKYLAYIDAYSALSEINILDLTSNQIISFPQIAPCSSVHWAPDNINLVASCEEVYIVNLMDQTLTPIILGRGPQQTDVDVVSWSPNGKWIAIRRFYDNMWDRDLGGELYLIDTICLMDPITCHEHMRFVDKVRSNFESPTWSPDSMYLAAYLHNGEIGIWGTTQAKVKKVKIPDWEKGNDIFRPYGDLAWSPDGVWFAFTQLNPGNELKRDSYDIYLMPVSGEGKKVLLQTNTIYWVAGWFVIPYLAEPGKVYEITSIGEQLRLHVSPGLDSEIRYQLESGEIVTVLDGLKEVDGYQWWEIITETGNKGWAVCIPEWYEPKN